MIEVKKISEPSELELAFRIREKVFVDEQHVSKTDEYDEYEPVSTHFLAYERDSGTPCGTARWRYTDKGVKLERFAVLREYRAKGVGSRLLQAVLRDVASRPESRGKNLYLHAQIQVVDFYAKAGFQKVGDIFEECRILHYKMVRQAE